MTEPLGFEDAVKRINEIAEVTQLTVPPSGSDHAPRTSQMGLQGRRGRLSLNFANCVDAIVLSHRYTDSRAS